MLRPLLYFSKCDHPFKYPEQIQIQKSRTTIGLADGRIIRRQRLTVGHDRSRVRMFRSTTANLVEFNPRVATLAVQASILGDLKTVGDQGLLENGALRHVPGEDIILANPLRLAENREIKIGIHLPIDLAVNLPNLLGRIFPATPI